MKKTLLTISLIVSSCFFVSAESPAEVTFTPVMRIFAMIQDIMDRLVPILISIAALGLFWFMLLFVLKGANNPDERKKARDGVMWSLLAIFLMVAVWGILALISTTLGIDMGGEMQEFKLPGTL